MTDDKSPLNFPKNVKVIYMTFTECVAKIQSKFDFKISLKFPHKLCDFRPAF
ncbi:MAG: hypothetical protein LBQ24_02075 [Candidatus Peribacteria bacterium]|nr:hypothetical protein [Candidatus Peribacteria bacterium]